MTGRTRASTGGSERGTERASRVAINRRATLIAGLLGTAGLSVAFVIASQAGANWEAGWELWLARGTGWCALIALTASLCASPVGGIARSIRPEGNARAWTTALRRSLGITAAALASVHAAAAATGYLRGVWIAIWTWPYLRAGLLALLVLLLLLLTSFPRIVRLLRVRLWKPLHRLAYVAAALALMHVLLSPFAPRTPALVVLAVLVAAGLLRALRLRRASPERLNQDR